MKKHSLVIILTSFLVMACQNTDNLSSPTHSISTATASITSTNSLPTIALSATEHPPTPTPTTTSAQAQICFQHTQLLDDIDFSGILDIDYSVQNQYLAVATLDGLYMVDLDQERIVWAMPENEIGNAIFDQNENRLIVTMDEDQLAIFDVTTGELLHNVTENRHTATYNPINELVAIETVDYEIRIWDMNTAQELEILQANGEEIYWLAWSDDGAKLAANTAYGILFIYDRINDRYKLSHVIDERNRAGLYLKWSPDGTMLATTSQEGSVTIWDTDEGHEITTLEGHILGGAPIIAWSDDGSQIASGGNDSNIIIWNTKNWTILHTSETFRKERETSGTYRDPVSVVTWSPDNDFLASALVDGSISIWNPQTGELLAYSDAHTTIVHELIWLPNQNSFISHEPEMIFKWMLSPCDE